jgi:DNA replication protein DnaC
MIEHNTSIPREIKTIQSHYDYTIYWLLIEKKGKEIFGPKFKLYEEDAGIILQLLIYFLQDVPLAQKYKIDLRKGIILTGPVGCGKTTLISLMNQLLTTHHRHIVRACREIAFEFGVEGLEAIQRYTRKSFNQYSETTVTYCFDDLGLEPVVQHFGTACNVMAEILLSRYDLFIRFKMLTHITTNLNSQEIESFYGDRVRSRCREMFNLISFDMNSIDKRC